MLAAEIQYETLTRSLLIAFVIFVLDIVSSNLMSLLYGLFN